MAEKSPAKTLKELSIINKDIGTMEDLLKDINAGNTAQLEKVLKIINNTNKAQASKLDILEDITRELKEQAKILEGINDKEQKDYVKALKEVSKAQERIKKETESIQNAQKVLNELYNETGKAMSYLVRQNKEIFETSHNMQLENNVTWRQFTTLYNEAYDAARRLNAETGKQLFTAKEMVKLQDKLMSSGWKNLDPTTLSNMTASMGMLYRTLGDIDDRLVEAFEVSIRQFGSQTDTFITAIGNRLNAFSNTFGMHVGQLQGTVASMMTQNTFLNRNNMRAQIAASENLMMAASLSSAMGLQSHDIIKRLADTTQFGTASQMAELYQAGAYLQDFSTSDFQMSMQNQDYYGAMQSLFSSISKTIGGMDAGYLRNEYMSRISAGFGLSNEDIMKIVQNNGMMGEYTKDIQDKLLKSSKSMEEEIADLHMTLIDQIENWWANSDVSRGLGSLFNEAGLYGINTHLKVIAGLIAASSGKDSLLGSITGSVASKVAGVKGAGAKGVGAMPTILGSVGKGLGGTAIGVGGNVIGHNLIANNTSKNVNTDFAGAALNIGSAAIGGAMIGSMIPIPGAGVIGALIGTGIGAINSIVAASKRDRDAMAEVEAARREAIRASATPVSTGNPIVDAINNQTRVLEGAIVGTSEETQRMSFVLNMAEKTTTRNMTTTTKE